MPVVEVTREIEMAATSATVWSVLSTPSQQPVIEPRVRLVTEWGTPGTVGSGYELEMRGRPTMRLTVTDAIPGELHAVGIDMKGRRRGAQTARLRSTEEGSILTYTFSIEVPLLMAPIQRSYGNRQLARWLDAVALVSSMTEAQQP